MDAIDVYKLVLNGKLKKFPKGFWNKHGGIENAKEIMKYLFEDVLAYSDKDILANVTQDFFIPHRLRGMMILCFNGSPYDAINSLYPDRFKPWEYCMSKLRYWKDKDNCIKATKWLIEEKLKWNEEDVKKKINNKTFIENGLNGMSTIFNDSTYEILDLAYPGVFKPWELIQTGKEFFDDDNNVNWALDWLFDEQLKWTDEELKLKFDVKVIRENNLLGLLRKRFHGSPYELLNYYYPNRFNAWELKQTPKRFWEKKSNRINAINWLISNEGIMIEEFKSVLNRKLLTKYKLSSLATYYNGNMSSLRIDLFTSENDKKDKSHELYK